ncbi:hypothetical protein QFC21_006780 [Naganishia friedmannii]|uniref:Uncharacterized protein n=1 Tax=Naganishia friedmannii TaxID=89922 RepID=A0ACC2V0M4_9TREE|nr:hypothetical protein QFC21_006780 [Naganishia friedmannii]
MTGPYTLNRLPQTPQLLKDDGIQETPGPVRARLAMMDKQMDQLHKEKSLLERKHKAESSNLQSQVSKLSSQLSDTTGALSTSQNQLHKLTTSLASAEEEMTRLRAFAQQAEEMREAHADREEMQARFELEMRLVQQKAGLQAAKHELVVLECERTYLKLERRFEQVSAENEGYIAADRADEDNSQIAAQSTAKSLQAEKAQRTKTAKELERLQLAHKRLEQCLVQHEQTTRASGLQTGELQAALKNAKEALTRETDKCARLDKVVVEMKDKNRELQKELDELVNDDTGRSGETEKEIRALRVELKGLKASMTTKEVDLEEAQEELQKARSDLRERDKALRKESREVETLQDKLTSVEEENHELREKNAHILVKARAYRQQAKGLAATAAEEDGGESVEREEAVALPKQKKTVVARKPAVLAVHEPEAKKARRARAASEESAARSDSEPPVVEPKKRKQVADTRAELQEDADDIAPAPKRRTLAAKPVYKEESSVSDDSRAKKPASSSSSSQPLAERVDGVANIAAGKTSNTSKASLAGKKALPATIMEESESEEPQRPKVASVGKEDKAAAGGEKKKKRKLGALLGGTTFTWDQNLNPDGPIPTSLSPLKSSAGSIPRAGFTGGMSRKFASRV